MARLSLHVFGSLEVLLDGIPVTSFESDKVRALLAYLAVEGERPQRRETLIGLLWPDYPEQDARHSLRQALFKLRLVLGDHTAKPPYLLITRDAIQFNYASDVSLDLAQFNAGYAAWEKNRASLEEAGSNHLDLLESMSELYRGEFLQHFSLEDSAAFEEWKLVQRETLHQRAMDLLACLTTSYEKQGEYRVARRYAERQLGLDPWREEAHGQLTRLLALDGQRSAALAQYEICQRVLREELGVEPSQTLREMVEQIRQGTLETEPRLLPPVHSAALLPLPVSLTSFVGRERELCDLGRLIADPQCRCISLVAPGGFGKTRLALQAADLLGNTFSHGAAFIPLASVASVDAAVPAIANAIRFVFHGPSDPKLQLLNHLRDKNMLLVVDNVEHLLVEEPRHGDMAKGTIAELLLEILQHAAGIKLLVTSREALNIQGEWLLEVQGLRFPDAERITEMETPGTARLVSADPCDAVMLFVQRAQRIQPGFALNDENIPGVVRLCRLVEGMPLAIELAATWLRLLSPEEIVTEIQTDLDFLNTQLRDIPERHRSMRAVFDHSWQMLSAEEQKVLSRLSVFRGGFDRHAADQVAGATLSILSTLVTRSLLRRTNSGRYDLHELIRQYAATKLAENSSELDTVQDRHSRYFLGLLEQNNDRLHNRHQRAALSEVTPEMDNIRKAWNWAISHHQFLSLYRVFMALWHVLEIHNWFKEGETTWRHTAEALREYIQEVRPESVEYQIALQATLADWAYFQFRQGRSSEAYPTLSSSAAYLRTCPDPSAAVESLLYLGIVCWSMGKIDEARENLKICLEFSKQYGKRWFEASANEFLGVVVHDQGAYQQAERYLREGLDIYRQIGDPMITGHVLSYLGRTLRALGQYSEAERLLREGLSLTQGMEYGFGSALILDALGQVAFDQGNYAEAMPLFQQSAAYFWEIGDHAHRLSKTLSHQGLNFLALNQVPEARHSFITALRSAQEEGLAPSTLNALAGLAAIETRQKPGRQTLELVIFILQHPASNEEAKALSSRLRGELESILSTEEIEGALSGVQLRKLDEYIEQFLNE